MSRGHGRVERLILEAVGSSSRHGATIDGLVWRCYPNPTEAQVEAVRRAVARLVGEGRLMEQSGFYGHRISAAAASKPRTVHVSVESGWRQCVPCEVQWLEEHATGCWSCGSPGVPGASPADEP